MPGMRVITICHYCVSVAAAPDASPPAALGVEGLSQSLANVCIAEKIPTVATCVADAKTGSPAVQNSNTDQDASVDNLR